jgi:HSP90 family molecular chaperone
MGVIEDAPNRNKLAKLLRFKSSTSDDKLVSLEEYVAKMPDWQQEIYFIAGESMNAVKRSPFLEVATRKKVQVLYLVEPIDECESDIPSPPMTAVSRDMHIQVDLP